MEEKSKESLFNKNPSYYYTFNLHLKLLLKKSVLIYIRNYISTILLILTPILSCFLLFFLQLLANHYIKSYKTLEFDIVDLNTVKKCTNPSNCITIGYSIISGDTTNKTEPEYISKIMQKVSKDNNLIYNKDVKLNVIGNTSSYLKYIETHPNLTFYNIVFCLDTLNVGGINFPCSFEYENNNNSDLFLYTILYNTSLMPTYFMLMPNKPQPTDRHLTSLKISMDNAIIEYLYNKSNTNNNINNNISTTIPKIESQMQAYPMNENRFLKGLDLEGFAGPFFFYFPPMFLFVSLLIEMVKEKSLKLRRSLIIIGLNNLSYWVSWIIVGGILSFIITILLIVTSIIMKYQVFINTPFLIMFILFFLFGVSMTIFSMFLSTVISTIKAAYTASFAIFLVGLVMMLLLCNHLIMFGLYSNDLPKFVPVLIFIFNLFPPFNFCKLYDLISFKAAPRLDRNTRLRTKGRKYTWKDLGRAIKGKTFFSLSYHVPPPFTAYIWLIVNSIFYIILTWYFDNALQSNKGRTYGFLFLFKKEYWFGSNSTKEILKGKIINNEYNTKEDNINDDKDDNIDDNDDKINTLSKRLENTVLKEKKKVHNILQSIYESDKYMSNNGLLIYDISKLYELDKACPCSKSRYLQALSSVDLYIPYGELFTLLGQNGAGKTTLLNILTSNITKTKGDAIVDEYNLDTGLYNIIGLCPQHDILWDELTAKEHIEMYCNIRSI